MQTKIFSFKLDMSDPLFWGRNKDGYIAHSHAELLIHLQNDAEIINTSTCTDGKFLYVTYHLLYRNGYVG